MANLGKINETGMKESIEEKDANIIDEEFTEEETRGHLRVKENDFITGMLAAAEDKDESTTEIQIIRSGKLFFSFRIRALGEAEATRCRKKHTKYVRNKSLGVKFADETDQAKFHSSLIYHATVEEDRAKVWDNKEVWKALNAKGKLIANALDVIETVLLGGEKDRIIDEINKISGFDSDNLEEVENERIESTKN